MTKTLQQIFNLGVAKGLEKDPRTKAEITEILRNRKQAFESLKGNEKKYFDEEKLVHLYDDSRVFFGHDAKISRILVGIDCGSDELLLANELNRNGEKIDAVMAHHPQSRSLIGLPAVMDIQNTIVMREGVSENVAEKILYPRQQEISRNIHATNHNRAVRTAELLNLPYFNIHTPADNCVYDFLTKNICQKKFQNLDKIIEDLLKIPEYQAEAKKGILPEIFCGNKNSRPGKIVATGMTGGTEGSADIYEKLANSGVGTLLDMHISEKNRKEAEKHHLNVIVCPHMGSDSIGINIICDEFQKAGIEIVACSGFTRVSRV